MWDCRKFIAALGVVAAGGSCAVREGATTPPVTASHADTRGARGAQSNPFAGARLYVNSDFAKSVESSLPSDPTAASSFRKVASHSVGIWLDSIARVPTVRRHLEDARAQQTATGQPVVVTFVVYDLPNRDCAAKSSSGELATENGGEQRYKTEYIDRIAAELRRRPDVRVVAILEPDSLANLATNLNVAKCAASEQVYRRSVAYAVNALSMPSVSLYLDAAHAGWLGWEGNRAKISRIFREVLTEAGGADKIRGFSTNVSNYNVVRGDDGRRLEPSNPCPDEMTYVQKLSASLEREGITNKGFVIDTSRNGRPGIRSRWGHWCNIKGAGLGERPRASPAPLVDAFYWVKPPGESDGTSDPTARRYDATCGSPDSAPDAPQAGQWFAPYFADLVKNAAPPL